MDIISNSINKNRHIHTFQYTHEQTWENFELQSKDRKILVYGAGGGLRHLIRSKPNMQVDAVIDSSPEYDGKVVGELNEESVCTRFVYMPIYSAEYLRKVIPENTVILLTNVKEYEAISQQLFEMGFRHIFVMLLMECNDLHRKESSALFSVRDTFEAHATDVANYILEKSEVENKIVFSIGAYGGHARAITRALLDNGCKYDIVWIVRDTELEHPHGVRLVKDEWWLSLYELETACMWIYDVMVPLYVTKRKGQKYIQVKHWSSLTLKRFYLEDGDTCKDDYPQREIRKNSEWMDIVFSGSTIDEDTCRSGFGVDDIFKRIGSPRSDVLFQSGIKEKVYRYYAIPDAKRCIVYAPTFRSTQLFQAEKVLMELDAERVMRACAEKFGSDWIVLLRLHPIIAEKNKDIVLPQNVIMVSDYPDSQELVAAADILITDYSSLMFEPAYVGKKVFLFAPDRDKYIEKERTLIFDYDALPFPIAETNEELVDVIRIFDETQYQRQLSSFLNKYEVNEDGHASERAADIILDLLEEK